MKSVLFALAVLVPLSSCWKPISVHPAAFSYTQSHPAIGGGSETASSSITRKSSNELLNSDSVDSLLESFHKDDYSHSHHIEDVSALRHLNDGRIPSRAKALHFESSIFNGIFHDVSKVSECLWHSLAKKNILLTPTLFSLTLVLCLILTLFLSLYLSFSKSFIFIFHFPLYAKFKFLFHSFFSSLLSWANKFHLSHTRTQKGKILRRCKTSGCEIFLTFFLTRSFSSFLVKLAKKLLNVVKWLVENLKI